MAGENGDRVEYGRLLERLETVEERMTRVEARQEAFLTQANQIFRQIGDRERLQLLDVRLSIFERLAKLGFIGLCILLYVVKHPF